jgi:hypothetical protein
LEKWWGTAAAIALEKWWRTATAIALEVTAWDPQS